MEHRTASAPWGMKHKMRRGILGLRPRVAPPTPHPSAQYIIFKKKYISHASNQIPLRLFFTFLP